MPAKTTWILVADGRQGKMFAYRGRDGGLETLPHLMFGEQHRKARDINSDRPGREYASVGTARSAMDPQTDPVDYEEAEFARSLAATLDRESQDGAFDSLVIAAAPQALGDLRKFLSPGVQAKVIAELPKDLTNIPTNDLAKHFDRLFAA